MAHDKASIDAQIVGNRYDVVGDEVASILASARAAAAEMRDQAQHYADSLLANAQQQAEDLKRNSKVESARIVSDARKESEQILLQTRREVLRIIEAARSRVNDAEKSADEIGRRRDEMLHSEAELEKGVLQVVDGLRRELSKLSERREIQVAADQASRSARPSEDLEQLLVVSRTSLVEAEVASRQENAATEGNGNADVPSLALVYQDEEPEEKAD